MRELVRRQIISLFVEGGGTVLGSFVDAGLVDKVYAFYGPLLIGGTDAIGAIGGQGAATLAQALRLTDLNYKKLDNTILISGYSTCQ
jgi:diaminohydroxyphosphoribosylaminopyrimidine deaminase/5-amino-6-(5-phosphoribosylamino)uracil reductase